MSEGDDLRRQAEELCFDREWDLYLKSNATGWDLKSMTLLMSIKTVADFWRTFNNLPNILVGTCNLFLMAKGVKPLWEENGGLFDGGGCWSVVVRSGSSWLEVSQNLAMCLVGESAFGETVMGACFVPVGNHHVICKIWCTAKRQSDGDTLTSALREFSPCAARFKLFATG